jgi:hypothetical protein
MLCLIPACSANSWRPKMEAIYSTETLDDFCWTTRRYRSRDIAVGTANGYGLDDRGGTSPGRVNNFIFSTSSRPALGPTQPPIQCVPRALYTGVKRAGREADHSSPVSAKKKNVYLHIHPPPLRLHGEGLN